MFLPKGDEGRRQLERDFWKSIKGRRPKPTGFGPGCKPTVGLEPPETSVTEKMFRELDQLEAIANKYQQEYQTVVRENGLLLEQVLELRRLNSEQKIKLEQSQHHVLIMAVICLVMLVATSGAVTYHLRTEGPGSKINARK